MERTRDTQVLFYEVGYYAYCHCIQNNSMKFSLIRRESDQPVLLFCNGDTYCTTHFHPLRKERKGDKWEKHKGQCVCTSVSRVGAIQGMTNVN
jgi:hypothetical protein